MKPNQVVMDIENYTNYFLVMFVNSKGQSKYFEMYEDHPLDIEGILKVMRAAEVVTFNGNNYDIPILTLALSGADNESLKTASDAIIVDNLRSWEFYKRYKLDQPKWNHIDLIEPAPAVKISLKLYGGRMHSKRLQDLPIEPDTIITPEQREVLVKYCRNDLDTTIDLLNAVDERIELRRKMSDQYGLDLRSKSDAQIAEAIIKKRIEELTGNKVHKSKVVRRTFAYQKPDFVKFKSPELNEILQKICDAEFVSEPNGVISCEVLNGLTYKLNNTLYQFGIGGLHSKEHERYFVADEEYSLWDWDVASYYPSIIIQLGLFPEALGEEFLTIFKDITKTRLEAKRKGDKIANEGGKIQINGTFGKTGSVYSILFAPNLMIQTTVTGQLTLMMLIEKLEEFGISVISANTDGIIMRVPRKFEETRMKPIIKAWETRTGFEMESTEYKAVYSRDVNSYVAIKTDNKYKTKGFFATGGLQKSPTNEICSKAFIKYLVDGTPIEDTICAYKDIRDFLSIRTVKGGAVKGGEYLGKAIRWYYAEGVEGTINYKSNGNTVPRSEGAKPCMVLPDEFPDDINYEWYINEAYDMLMDVGLKKRPKPAKIPRKGCKAWQELVDNGYLIQDGEEWVWYC